MAEKKYYWLKMTDQFFEDKAIKKLRKIAGGDTYTIIYLKMLLTAIKQGNKMYFEGIEDDFMEELALELDEDTDNVKVTVSYLKSKGLIEVLGADEILLTQCAEMVGSETDAARRKRLQRDRQRNRAIGSDPAPALEEKPEVVVEEKTAKKKAENTIQLFHRLVEDYNISEPVREKMEVWFRYKMERKESYKQRTMEVAENIGKTHSITCQLAPYDMRMVYSLMYGMKITNNFLKMHGGIMVRNAARRKCRRK